MFLLHKSYPMTSVWNPLFHKWYLFCRDKCVLSNNGWFMYKWLTTPAIPVSMMPTSRAHEVELAPHSLLREIWSCSRVKGRRYVDYTALIICEVPYHTTAQIIQRKVRRDREQKPGRILKGWRKKMNVWSAFSHKRVNTRMSTAPSVKTADLVKWTGPELLLRHLSSPPRIPPEICLSQISFSIN